MISLGGKTYTGAQVWGTLAPWILDRTVFFHHATFTNNHANLSKVLRLMGQTARQEMLPSIAVRLGDDADATRRASLVTSQIGGLILTRYVLRLEPVASMSHRELARRMAPGIRAAIAVPAGPMRR